MASNFRPRMKDEPPSFTEGQEDRIVTLQGPWVRSMRRFKYYIGAALVVLALGNGVALKLVQEQAHQACTERNERAIAAGKALAKLAEASRQDGDPRSAEVWEEYLEATRKAPIPQC